ncbi:type IX secretion system membrane protein PorP/SprF [candidate division KSB1 bacterium]|nr:type IX secretion system membrane protein PorP/SprF [candidate division KSB1 bacterium]
MTGFQKTLAAVFLLILIIAAISPAFAQDYILETNPADVRDPRAAFVNPAIISRQGIPVVAGMRILHLGIADNSFAIKHSFLGGSCDIPVFGFHYGANLQVLNHIKIREMRGSLLLSRPLIDILALGLNMNILTRDYPDKSDMIDEEDLPGTADFSFGCGLFLGPVQDFTVGLSLDHINQPDVTSDNSGFHQPLTMDFGVQYTYGFFSPSLYMHYAKENTSVMFGVEGAKPTLGMLRMALGGEKLVFEGKLNLFDERMGMGYRLDFPLNELNTASYGSHQIVFSYRFVSPRSIDAFFTVDAKFDKLTITRKWVSIVANKGVTIDDIDALKKYKVNIFDDESRKSFIKNAQQISGRDLTNYERVELDDTFLQHKALLRKLVAQKRAKLGRQDVPIKIMAPPGTGTRAIGLLGFIVDSLQIPSDSVNIVFTPGADGEDQKKFEEILEQLRAKIADRRGLMRKVQINIIADETLSHDTAVFEAKRRVASASSVHSWRLTIKKGDDIVSTLAGTSDPKRITWNWRDKQKKRIRQGKYKYYLEWKNKALSGWEPENPEVHSFQVTELPSSVTYHLGDDVKSASEESVEFFLKPED